MYSNEQFDGRSSRQPQPHYRPRPAQTENTLHYLQAQSGDKTIILALQSNWRGQFIRVIVKENEWHNSIIIPSGLAEEFRECVETVTQDGQAAKGMVESDGKTIFVRLDHDDLLLGERTGTRNVSVIIPQAAFVDFKKMFDELLEFALAESNRSDAPQRKARLDEKIYYSEDLTAGTKTIRLMLKENALGRFVRLVEGDGLRFTSVMIPAQQLETFRAMLDEAINVCNETP